MLQKGKDDNQFDIAEALKTRKPLRKTTKAKLMVDTGPQDGGKGEGFLHKNRLKRSTVAQGEKDAVLLPTRVKNSNVAHLPY